MKRQPRVVPDGQDERCGGRPIITELQPAHIASSCETWNCAVAALVLAGGDKHVITLPTGNQDRPWLILRRVPDGRTVVTSIADCSKPVKRRAVR